MSATIPSSPWYCCLGGQPTDRHKIYEQSRLASEVGAAVHLAPNSNGVLRHWGIFAEQFGGTLMKAHIEYNESGLVKEVELTEANKGWQHPWHLVHRVALHDKLKQVATAEDGPGITPTLKTSSKVLSVDPEAGRVVFEDGSSVEADVVIGADGLYVSDDGFHSAGIV